MSRLFTKYLLRAGLLSAISGISLTAAAGGFQLLEESVSGMGNAFAGVGATAEDASTEYYNPAGMTLLNEPQMVFAGTALDVNIDAHFQSATNNGTVSGSTVPTATAGGAQNVHPGGWAFIPAFHFVYPGENKLAFGFGITSPYGLETNYPDEAISRYMATQSKINTINVGPNIAYQMTPKFSVGLGVDAQYLQASLNQFASVPFAYSALSIPPQFVNGIFTNKGSDWGYGWNAGALYQVSPVTRVGLAYRSSITHDIKGDASLDLIGLPDNLPLQIGAIGSVNTSLTLPASLDLSFFHDFNSKWGMVAGLDYTDWSEVKQLTLNYGGSITEAVQSVTIPLNFQDTLRYALGANYYATDRWTLRGGIAFDESPVPNSSSRTIRLPDADRIWAACGAKYKINDQFSVDAGYAHLFVSNAAVNNTQNFSGNLLNTIPYTISNNIVGNFNSDVNEFGLQLTWNLM